MSENNKMMSVEGQLVGMPLAGPESFSQQQLEYLKRALGVDETVLYDGNGTGVSTCVFNESMLNFSEIKIIVGNISGTEGLYFINMPAKEFAQLHITYNAGGGGNEYFVGCYGSISSTGISLTKCVAVRSPYSNGTPATTIDNNSVYMPCIHKVVGIHRISGGNQ